MLVLRLYRDRTLLLGLLLNVNEFFSSWSDQPEPTCWRQVFMRSCKQRTCIRVDPGLGVVQTCYQKHQRTPPRPQHSLTGMLNLLQNKLTAFVVIIGASLFCSGL